MVQVRSLFVMGFGIDIVKYVDWIKCTKNCFLYEFDDSYFEEDLREDAI